jgi:uncharacterized protein DUF5947
MNPDTLEGGQSSSALSALRRFARPRAARERCELCDAELADDHAHLIEVATRRLACACTACALLFSGRGPGRYRQVPRRVQYLADFVLTDASWEQLQLPINLAFFLESASTGRVTALYPSPAGATESLVPLEHWQALAQINPVLATLEPDVEALLVNRMGEACECYRVGIDECYKLVGLIRLHWRGFSGGQAAWDEIGRFFLGLKERSHA